MILVRHDVRGPGNAAAWIQNELRIGDLAFIRSRYEGAYRDEIFCPERAEGCSSIRFVLDGPLVVAAADLRKGQLYASATHGTAGARALTMKSDVLIIGWRGRPIDRDVRIAPSRSTTTLLHTLADALAGGDVTQSWAAARPVIEALRAEGFPFLPVGGDPVICVAQQRLAKAIERALASLSSHPTSVDLALALDVGEHHALRRTNAYFRELHFSVNGWREYLRRRRIDLGAFFMGRPDARTEDVARVLGFRSPTSFCHAFQAAGLPSPRAVQSHLLAA